MSDGETAAVASGEAADRRASASKRPLKARRKRRAAATAPESDSDEDDVIVVQNHSDRARRGREWGARRHR